MSQQDDVSKLYDLPQLIDKILNITFIFNMVAAFASIFLSHELKQCTYYIQVISSVSYIVLYAINNYECWYKAESVRNQTNIENAFSVSLTEYTTEEYYNNRFPPSWERYFVNTFESVFFSKNISESLRIRAFIKSLVALYIFIIAIMQVQDGVYYPIIAQTVFSSLFLLSSIALFVYYNKLNHLYNNFYRELVTNGVTSPSQLSCLLGFCVEYEMIKSRFNVLWSKNYFKERNRDLSKRWDMIESKIRFDKQQDLHQA